MKMKMKMKMKVLLAMCLIAVSAVPAFAVITGSKHDFSASGSTHSVFDGGQTQICIFCHVPHNAYNTTLLWSRDKTTGITAASSFKMYSSTTGSTAILPSATQLTGNESSWLCLTCHDGTKASMQTNTKAYVATLAGGTAYDASGRIGGAPNLVNKADYLSGTGGGVLRDDHPINFSYAASYTAKGGAGSGLTALATLEAVPGATSLTIGSSKPFDAGGKMQCSSCHLVHDEGNTGAGLLRKPKAASAICLQCHIK
jgi:predicted CXXCH cytochrome family protein